MTLDEIRENPVLYLEALTGVNLHEYQKQFLEEMEQIHLHSHQYLKRVLFDYESNEE